MTDKKPNEYVKGQFRRLMEAIESDISKQDKIVDEACIAIDSAYEQGKLDQSFLSADKNLGKIELDIAIDEAIVHIQNERDECDRFCCSECGRRDIALSVFKRLKSQLKTEGEKR